jgi:hypothetical protein
MIMLLSPLWRAIIHLLEALEKRRKKDKKRKKRKRKEKRERETTRERERGRRCDAGRFGIDSDPGFV